MSVNTLPKDDEFDNFAGTMTESIQSNCCINHQECRVLTLENDQHQEATIYRLEKEWCLEFRLGPSLFGHQVSIFTNVPTNGQPFDRKSYRKLEWSNPAASDDSLAAKVFMDRAGSYHYYFQFDDSPKRRGSGYFIVDPVLPYGDETLSLDCIQCVTYLAKNLGPFSAWEKKLLVAKETGYNMIHFTPIQELGGSQSAYSLQDQLKINSKFCDQKYPTLGINDITALTEKLRKEWKMLSICDIVLNHTANESLWLKEHPEATYNMINCPYLKPAYLLDMTLFNFSMEVSKGLWELNGIPEIVCNEEHLNAIRYALLENVLPKVKIEELYIVDVDSIVAEFLQKCRSLPPPSSNPNTTGVLPNLNIVQDEEFRRKRSTVDMNLALQLYNTFRNDCFDEQTRLQKCASEFKSHLEALNTDLKNTLKNHITAGIDNCIAGLRYFRVQPDGPGIREITAESPLFSRYFTDYNNEPLEDHMYTAKGAFIMAHNGWLINADPLKNFADRESQVYLCRELIAWGDSVKLRYGNAPEDCPYLWDRMRQYVEQTVRAFDGVRLDNCHSTPIHVAEYLLDAARKVRPNLYVVAELFTNSDFTDNLFVNRLGITSLIRESMSAWDSHELGRLVHRYGGEPVGAFMKPFSRPLTPSVAHALFLDLTHDNPSPIEKRSVFDLLPSSALVSMACCASGSNMGYDQLVPHHIHVVEETRTYMEWGNDQVVEDTGIVSGKKALNDLHYYLGKNGFKQVFVDQINSDIVCVTRHNRVSHETVILIAYTAFWYPNPSASGEGFGVTVTGRVENVLLEAYLENRTGDRYAKHNNFTKNKYIINGLNDYKLNIKKNFPAKDVSMVQLVDLSDNSIRVNLTQNFKPGSVVSIKFTQNAKIQEQFAKLNQLPNLDEIKKPLTLSDLNKILYCCDSEDGGVYNVPNFSPFVYCGLQGLLSAMDTIAFNNDLGHPICQNLREGDWMIDYTINRLKTKPGTKKFAEKLEEIYQPLRAIPRYLVPCYFYRLTNYIYKEVVELAWSLMADPVQRGSEFYKLLALGSLQFGGYVESSPLPPLSSNLNPPQPELAGDKKTPLCVSLSAGLPHFATGYMRNWGRDTFISLRGLFLLTGRYDEARYIILGYAGCLRHGLIPNLLDGGNNARFNCRDAIWWWLYTIKCYVSTVPGGEKILTDKVNRLYPTDDSPLVSQDQTLSDVIQEAMNKHFQGLCFRERNAGPAIDAHMKSTGFDNQIGVHPVTGFVFGGNEWNCGTWMDKMGSSDKAGNRGQPATPRDGSAIEIVALSKASVHWLAEMNKKGFYPYDGVTRKGNNGSEVRWTYVEWDEKLQANFEKYFWVPTTPNPNEARPDLVHRKGIYKDCVGASQPWTDYQLRCNYCVAMVVAPELFTPKNAWIALETMKTVLLGPLGMKTLDPADWAYNGYYDNSNDSADHNVAHGFNYHQGPEWLWPVGFYLRARVHFASVLGNNNLIKEVLSECKSYLANHYIHLKKSDWKGLPELTNKDAVFCPFSCATQAWSMATILEAVDDITKMESKLS
ncbi:glycogen debranching enzyme isoform X2 [Planococcus citri]